MTDDPAKAAAERGQAASRALIENRDKLFEPIMALMLIAGEPGMRASVAGVIEAVVKTVRNRIGGEGAA